jgi:hypothetical protein
VFHGTEAGQRQPGRAQTALVALQTQTRERPGPSLVRTLSNKSHPAQDEAACHRSVSLFSNHPPTPPSKSESFRFDILWPRATCAGKSTATFQIFHFMIENVLNFAFAAAVNASRRMPQHGGQNLRRSPLLRIFT